jgi:exopolyphosphatase/guanosine-5'-triphosphate,3'-diphosphate pyrophosphatase
MSEPGGSSAPRWEWRTFGARLPEIEAKLGPTARIAPRQSDEIYLLNSATPHSAKIRGGVLEVKRLLQVDSSGLEQWTPAFKERFPLSAPMLRSAFAALDVRPIATQREVYDLEEFLAEAAASDGPLRAVEVKKARRQFMYRDCAAEFDHVRIGPVARESFCVESEDPSKVIAAVQEMGLDPHANINFSKGIERALARSTPAG